ncbi:unnamed protein product, partial [marine sediment metagenome]
MDIFVEVPHIDYEKLADDRLGEKSDKVQARGGWGIFLHFAGLILRGWYFSP